MPGKKILLLGGSVQQVVAIETAKRLGYQTVLCDYLPDNPGQYCADTFYLVSTTDKEAVLRVAREENVDGVLAYASDPAAPTAAYVAEAMGLPTNPYQAVKTLCNKELFRAFLKRNGFNAPRSEGYGDSNLALASLGLFHFPVIVKPVDSSGSKGVTVLRGRENAETAIEMAFAFSRSKRIIVEEFIEKDHPYLIGGDIFVIDGKIVLWGLMNCHRDPHVNPLVPVGKSYPLMLKEENIEAVQEALRALVQKLDIRNGAMNVEAVVDSHGKVWLIDVGPRSGGNMIPDLLGMIFHVDVVEMAVKLAMGKAVEVNVHQGASCFATHNLHSDRDGKFVDVRISAELEKYIIRKCIYKHKGDVVERFDNAAKVLGIIFMHFDNVEIMEYRLSRIEQDIEVILE